ncbi:glycosyltransferase family 4 protein [Candidatus Falkowbacteria bacterium]|nr:glycosyltransferase family 4 protein [Candidatus Falkowbacteria bacterium]
MQQLSNNKKTILYLITQSELGGAQCYVLDLATRLNKEFKIIAGFGEQGERGEMARQLKEAGVECRALPHLKRAISPFNDLLALWEIIKLIKKIRPDIIHLNSSKISILGSLAALFASLLNFKLKSKIENRKSKIIYTVHGWVFNEPLPLWQKFFYKYAEKITTLLKDKIICISKLDYETTLREKIAPEKKLVIIHHGRKPINFLPKNEALDKLIGGLQPATYNLLIGTIANLYKTKGLECLINAANILKSIIPDSKFIILVIGEGEERKNLERLIKQNGLENNFMLAGKIANAAELLKAFDIYVCSSLKEGLPYTIIEAMLAGLPIVATNVGGNPDLIKDAETGLLVEPQNPEQIAEKIKKLIDNPDLREKLGISAQNRAQKEFSLKQMVEKIKDVYLDD